MAIRTEIARVPYIIYMVVFYTTSVRTLYYIGTKVRETERKLRKMVNRSSTLTLLCYYI